LPRPSPYIPECSFLFHESQPAFSASGRIFQLDPDTKVLYQGSPINSEELNTGTTAKVTIRAGNIIETAEIVFLNRRATLLDLFNQTPIVFSKRKYRTHLLLNVLSDEQKYKPAVHYLRNRFFAMRKVGGEGKLAFWTAVGVAYLDYLVLPSTDSNELIAFSTQLNQAGDASFHPFLEKLQQAKTDRRGNEELDQYHENAAFHAALISAFRALIFAYALAHREQGAAMISLIDGEEGFKSVLEFQADLTDELRALTALALPIKLKVFDSFDLGTLGESFESDPEHKQLVHIHLLYGSNTFKILYTKAHCEAEGFSDFLDKREHREVKEITRKQLFSVPTAKMQLESTGLEEEEGSLMQKAGQILDLQETCQKLVLGVFEELANREQRAGVNFLTSELINAVYDTKEKYRKHLIALRSVLPDGAWESRLTPLENPNTSFSKLSGVEICSKCITHPAVCKLQCGHGICRLCFQIYIQERESKRLPSVRPDGQPLDDFVCPLRTCVSADPISKSALMLAVGETQFEQLVVFAEQVSLQKACKRCLRVQDNKFFPMCEHCGCKICASCLIENIKKKNGFCDCQQYIPQEISSRLINTKERCAGCGQSKSLVDDFTPLKCENHILCKVCLDQSVRANKRCSHCYRQFSEEEVMLVKPYLELPCELYCRQTFPVEILIRLECGHCFCKPCAKQAFFYYNQYDRCFVCYNPLTEVDRPEAEKLIYEVQVSATIKQPGTVSTCRICTGPIGLFQEFKLLCAHLFHKDCVNQHAENYAATAFDSSIKCPDSMCKQEIDQNLLVQLLDEHLYAKYDDRLAFLAMKGLITCPNVHCRYQFEIEGEYEDFQCPTCQWAICKSCKQPLQEGHDRKNCEFIQNQEKIEFLKQHGEGGDIAQCPGCRTPYQKKGCDLVQCITPGCCKWCFKCSALQVPIDIHGKAWHRPTCEHYLPGDPAQVQASEKCQECNRLQRRCDQPPALKVPQRFDRSEY